MISRFLVVATQVVVIASIVYVVLQFLRISILVIWFICVIRRTARRGLRGPRSGRGVVVDGEKVVRGLSSKDLEICNVGSVDCAICLENFEPGDRCRLLPICKHSFHADCIDSWLRKSSMCPICRMNTVSRNAEGYLKEIERPGEFNRDQSALSGLPPLTGASTSS